MSLTKRELAENSKHVGVVKLKFQNAFDCSLKKAYI